MGMIYFTLRSLYPQSKSIRLAFGMRVCYPHRSSGRADDDKAISPPANRTPAVLSIAVIFMSELFQLTSLLLRHLSFILRKDRTMWVIEKEVLRRLFGPQRQKITGIQNGFIMRFLCQILLGYCNQGG